MCSPTKTYYVIYDVNSIFEGNDGGGGGVLSTAYVPLKFSGNSFFSRNRGRTLVVGFETKCMCPYKRLSIV